MIYVYLSLETYRSKFNGKSVQLIERYWKSLKNSIEPEQYLIWRQNLETRSRMRPELCQKIYGPCSFKESVN